MYCQKTVRRAKAYTRAVGKDGGPVFALLSNVDGIPAFVLGPAEWFQPMISFEDHQVMAKAFELAVVSKLFKAVDDGVRSHTLFASRFVQLNASAIHIILFSKLCLPSGKPCHFSCLID